jgi:cytochrome b561
MRSAVREAPAGAIGARYTKTARVLHWLTAVLVLGTLPVGLVMTSIGQGELQNTLYSTHKLVGLTLIVIIALRIYWRATHRPPPLQAVTDWRIARVAVANHLILYVLLVVQVVSGYVLTKAGNYPIPLLDSVLPSLVPQSKPLSEGAALVHEINKSLIIVFVAVHICGALYHLLFRKDGVFYRIWPITR